MGEVFVLLMLSALHYANVAGFPSPLDVQLSFLCLITQSDGVNSYYDQNEYIGRSVHYWKVVLPLLERVKNRRSIPEPLDPLFIHFPSKDIQVNTIVIVSFLLY